MKYFSIQVVTLDLENTIPRENTIGDDIIFTKGVWHDPYEYTSHYDALTEKECAEVAIGYAKRSILELKDHIRRLKKIK